MKFIEVDFQVQPPEIGKDILIALLSAMDYESFMETDTGILAYIPISLFDKEKLEHLPLTADAAFTFTYNITEIENQNWNAIWENNYTAVLIENQCYIRAPFHESRKDVMYEIEIEPKMSFGTAHHETTELMIRYLLTENCEHKQVLDMGTGTGVLAILASMRGANSVVAIDNDEWAYSNCMENIERNRISNIHCLLGDAKNIPHQTFDLIIANINRNILMRDMEIYSKHINPNGIILLSGFYETEDLHHIKNKASQLKLHYHSHKEKNKWVAAKFYL